MDYSTLRRMSEDAFEKVFLGNLYDSPDFIVNIAKGHAKEIHIGKHDMELIARNVKENVSSATSFIDNESFIGSLQDILDFNTSKIYNWIQSNPKDFDNRRDYNEIAFSQDLGCGSIGYGFNKGDMTRYNISGIRVVLSRDTTGASPLGFYLSTAYPDITMSEKSDISYSYADIIKKSENVLTPMERLYIDARGKGLNACLQYVEDKQQVRIMEVLENKDVIYAYFTENDYSIKLADENGKRKIDTATLLYLTDKGKDIVSLEK